MTEIARGEIDISLKSDVEPELRRVEAEYRAAMARIDRMEASAKIKADTENLDRQIKEAKDRVRQLEGERATVTIKAEKKQLDEEIARAKAQVKELDGKKATIEIDTRGAEVALAKIEAVRKAEAARASADEKYARQRQRVADQEDKNRQLAERAAYRQGEIARKADLDSARQEQRIAALRNRYSQLTDEVEKVDKAAKGFHGRESQIKLEVNRQHLVASMEAAKAELNFLGGHPPVHVKVDTDKSDVGRVRNWINSIKGGLTSIAEKAGSLGHVRLNLGPFSGTIRTMGLAIAGLAPILTSLLGSATALVGVLGTGLAGAASIAGGTIAGLGLNLIGVLGAVKPAINDFKLAEQATTAYQTAVDKYGASSKQAKTAQAQMNQVLKSVDPTARQAAKGWANLSSEWHKLTGPAAKKALGDVLIGGIKTLNTLMPTLAHNTNQTFSILDQHLTGIEKAMRSKGGVNIFDSLGRSANAFLGPALGGLQHLGAAFAHVAESAARLFAGKAGSGFQTWAADIDHATQPGARLDATIQRLGNHATDLLHFFGALGRLLVTVFNGGANSGDRMVKSMTAALNRWNAFLQSTRGRADMASFFNRSEGAVRALWSALAPLIAAFVQWSNLLAPFTAGLLKGISFVSNLVGGLTKLIGLGGPLTALGATIGAVFAVTKLGAFLSMLIRVGATMKELGAIGSLKALLSGNFKSVMGAGLSGEAAQIREAHVQGGAEAAAAIREAHATGGAAAGGEIRAAEIEGGAAAGGEIRAAEIEGGAAAGGEIATAEVGAGAAAGGIGAAEVGAGAAAGGIGAAEVGGGAAAGGLFARLGKTRVVTAATGAIRGLGAAISGMSAFSAAATLGVTALIGVSLKLAIDGAAATDRLNAMGAAFQNNLKNANKLHSGFLLLRAGLEQVGSSYASSRQTLATARKELAATTKGTQAHRDALMNYRQALIQNNQQQQQYQAIVRGFTQTANNEVKVRTAAYKAYLQQNGPQVLAGAKAKLAADRAAGASAKQLAADQSLINSAQARYNSVVGPYIAALNAQAVAGDNAARSYRGMALLGGQAAQQVGALARAAGGSAIARKISLKFEVPKDAGAVAAQAQKALGSGVSQTTVMKIVADSKNAEDAIRRLNRATITPKKVQILESGGAHAVAVLQEIIGRKLTPKEQRIAQSGGQGVIALLQQIIGHKLNPKQLGISQSGGGTVQQMISAIAGHKINDKAFSITAAAAQATSAIGSVIGQLARIPRSVTTTVSVQRVPMSGHHAAGGMETPADKAAQRATGPVTTRGGSYSRPTFLVGEEDKTEYVIATNPAYRQSNVTYLAAAASDLGMSVVEAAAGGRRPKRAAPGTRTHHGGTPKHPYDPRTPGVPGTSSSLPVPDPYAVGAVPEQDVQDAVGKLDTDLATQKSLVKTLGTEIAGFKLTRATHDRHGHITNMRSVRASQARLRDLKAHRAAALGGGKWRNLNYTSIDDLTKEDTAAHSDLATLQGFNQSITHLNSLIDTDQKAMGKDSTLYDSTGDTKYLDDWRIKRADRLTQIGTLGGLLAKAKAAADKMYAKYGTINLQQLADNLGGQIEDNDGAAADSTTAVEPTGPTPPQAPSLDTVIESFGLTGTLADLNKAYALSQVNDVPDNPATPGVDEHAVSLSDNLTAAGGLKDFYAGVLSRAQSAGEPADVITEAANAFVSARDTYTGINDTITSAATTAAANAANDQTNYTSARADLFSQFGSNFAPIWSQPGPVPVGFGGTGFGGAGQQNAVMPNTTQVSVVNNFDAPPPDSHTWSNSLSWELQAAL